MGKQKWKSQAWWTSECCPSIGNYSEDTHWTKEEAEAVISLLYKDGFGGNRKFFPVMTRVEPVEDEVQLIK